MQWSLERPDDLPMGRRGAINLVARTGIHMPAWLPVLLIGQAILAGACIIYSGAATWVTGGLTVLLGLSTAMSVGLLVRVHHRDVERLNCVLEGEVSARLSEHVQLRDALIFGLAKLADYRDTDTGEHLDRIRVYCRLLAAELGSGGQCEIGDEIGAEIDELWIDRLMLASSLHDIGKVGIEDAVLLKPGALTPEERTIMERHAVIGADTLMAIRARLGEDELLDMAIQIALSHHEKWDGSGYPHGLSGEQIPLTARIVALADVYDALTSERVYKAAMPHEQAARIIREGRGSHFDPRIVDAFEACETAFEHVRGRTILGTIAPSELAQAA